MVQIVAGLLVYFGSRCANC